MKKIDIINAVNALGKVRITRIKDDRVKFTLAAAYRKLRKVSRDIDEERHCIIDKFQADFPDEFLEVQRLRDAGQPVVGFDEFLKAEADSNRLLRDISREEAEDIDIATLSADDFIKAVKDDELTFEDLAALDGIVIE